MLRLADCDADRAAADVAKFMKSECGGFSCRRPIDDWFGSRLCVGRGLEEGVEEVHGGLLMLLRVVARRRKDVNFCELTQFL